MKNMIFFFSFCLLFVNCSSQEYQIEIPFEHQLIVCGSDQELIVYGKASTEKVTSPWKAKVYNKFKDYTYRSDGDFGSGFYAYDLTKKKFKSTKIVSKDLQEVRTFEGRARPIGDDLIRIDMIFDSEEAWKTYLDENKKDEVLSPPPGPAKFLRKVGLFNARGKLLFPPIFDNIVKGRGIIYSRIGNTYYVLDPHKKVYHEVLRKGRAEIGSEVNELLAIKAEGILYLFDKNANFVFSDVVKDETRELFTSGNQIRKKYQLYDSLTNQTVIKFALLDSLGNTLIDDLDDLSWANNDHYFAGKKNEDAVVKYGILDSRGKPVTAFKYRAIKTASFKRFESVVDDPNNQSTFGSFGYFDSEFNELQFSKRHYSTDLDVLVDEGKAYQLPDYKLIKTPEEYDIQHYCGHNIFIAKSKETGKYGTILLKQFSTGF